MEYERTSKTCMHKEENFFYANTMLTPNEYVTVHYIKISFKVRFYLFVFFNYCFFFDLFYAYRLLRVNNYDVFSTVSFKITLNRSSLLLPNYKSTLQEHRWTHQVQ